MRPHIMLLDQDTRAKGDRRRLPPGQAVPLEEELSGGLPAKSRSHSYRFAINSYRRHGKIHCAHRFPLNPISFSANLKRHEHGTKNANVSAIDLGQV